MVKGTDPAAGTKHEQIIHHIKQLKIGSSISVRGVAKAMGVSEGTAYRAIKEAENLGLVSTRERIGTVRVERNQRTHMDKLTFAEVVGIVDGKVLGGSGGLDKRLSKFVIGAMQEDAMKGYIAEGSLLIVGNREHAHVIALQQGAGVLITGGFDTGDEVKSIADRLELPIISSAHDTFTVASMINRAIYDRVIKKKIMLAEDLIDAEAPVPALRSASTVGDWRRLADSTGMTRFPVVDDWHRVMGVVTAKDVQGEDMESSIDRLMTRNPLTVHAHTPLASAAHQMVWEGLELLPVTDASRRLVGTLGRKDVLRALQYIQQQPQSGETFDDLIWLSFEELQDEGGQLCFRGVITPQMTSHRGAVSEGVLTTLMTQAAFRAIKEIRRSDVVLENMSTYFLRPVQIESTVDIRPSIIEVSRKYGKVDVAVYHEGALAAKAMLTAQVMDLG